MAPTGPRRRHRNEVLDETAPPLERGVPDELECHRAAEAVAEDDDGPAMVLPARVLDEPRQPAEIAGVVDLGHLAGQRGSVPQVVWSSEEGFSVTVAKPPF